VKTQNGQDRRRTLREAKVHAGFQRQSDDDDDDDDDDELVCPFFTSQSVNELACS